MNFLRSSNKQNADPGNPIGERRRLAPFSKLIVTGLASAGLFLAGCAEAKEQPAPAPPSTTTTTTEAAPRTTIPKPTPEHRDTTQINSEVIKNIQEQAHERWPGKTCAFAFYKGGKL